MKPILTSASRLSFHSIFRNWLSNAPEHETDQLDELLSDFPSTEVRSMVTFIRDCLEDPARREKLPANLLQRLQATNWPLAAPALQAV